MKNAVHQQTTEGEEKEETINSRESQGCFRAEGDSELRATLTLQREWRKMAARVSEWMDDRVGVLVSGWVGGWMSK